MLIKGATRQEIEMALKTVNTEFNDNIVFKRFGCAGNTRDGEPKYNVTLTVRDSCEPGARRGHSGRRVKAACWHVHGTFIDALPKDTEVVSLGYKTYPGAYWRDWNIGSMAQPLYASEACDCD